MNQTQEDMQRLQQLFQILCNMMGFGKDIAESLITKYQRDYQEERGLRSIIGFIAHGGKAEQVTVGEEQADLFRRRLQEKHVTYYETIITRDDNTKQHLFMYKGMNVHNGKETPTPDKLQVERIKKMFELELSCNTKELDVHTFKDLMTGKDVGIADNLSLEQVYAFRENVKDTDIKFCVLQDGEDKYKIYASDTKKLTEILVKMSYDLANDDAGVFAQAAKMYAAKKNDFYEICGKEPFIICDRNNPNNFIYVDKRSYSLHSFQKEDELQPDGTIREVIRDATRPQVFSMDRERLFEHAKQIANPIKVSVKEFTLLSSVNKAGMAFASPDIAVSLAAFKEAHMSDELVVEKYPKRKPKFTEQMLDGYVHLPMSLVLQMKNDLPFIHTNDMDSIAFPKEQKNAVDTYLQAHVFDTIQDPMQALAFRWKIEGRTGNFNAQLTGDVNSDFYIINPDNDNMVIAVDPSGVHVYHDGKETAMCPAKAANYQEFLQQYISDDIIPNPVVLTQAEMQSENANQTISERANHSYENAAIIQMINIEEDEKQELIENIEHIHEIQLTPEQEKAVQQIDKLRIHSKELDGAVFVEMQDLAANKEITRDTEIDLR